MSTTVYLHNYYGKCTDENGNCNMDMYINNKGSFYGSISPIKCKPIENGCSINFSCNDCSFEKYVEMNMTILGVLAYIDTIEAVCLSGSSIPEGDSKTAAYVKATESKVFNGFKPSVFSFYMIPSVFYTDSGKWENERVGFHSMYVDLPVDGSEFPRMSKNYIG